MTPPLRASTDESDTDEWSLFDVQQGDEDIGIDETKTEKLSARERLERLSKFRTDPATIDFTTSVMDKVGGKAVVAQATLKRRRWRRQKQVAMKKLRAHGGMDSHMFENAFVDEVEMMAGLSHKNIARFLGFVEDLRNGEAWVISSLEPNGNLSEFLGAKKCNIPERISLIQDTFKGLRYLHTRRPPICHGDLNSLNIRVGSSYRAIITEFGSALVIRESGDGSTREVSEPGATGHPTSEEDGHQISVVATGNQLTLTAPTWSLDWVPPEVVNGNRPGLSSDIWSAGWVCWEIMTGKLPFSELGLSTANGTRVIQGRVASANEDEQRSQIVRLCNLMTECWEFDPQKRPTISRCCDEVKWMPSVPPQAGARSGSKVVANQLLLQMARTHHLHARYDHATSLFQQVLGGANRKKDRNERSEALYWLGSVSAAQCKYPTAEGYYTQAQDAYGLIGDDLGRASALRGLGDVYHLQSKISEAEEAFNGAREIYDAAGDDQGRASTLCGLGHIYRLRLDYTRAKETFSQSHEIYARIGDEQGRANTLHGLGSAYHFGSKWTEAEEALGGAKKIYARIGDDLGQAETLLGLGALDCDRHQYAQAESTITQALEILSRIGNERGQANGFYGLGKVYLGQSRYEEAVSTFGEAKAVYARIDQSAGQANSLHGLGDAYRGESKYDQATWSYTEAQKIYALVGQNERQASTLCSLGELYRLQSKYDQATWSYIEARNIYARIGQSERQADTLYNVGELYRLQSKYDQATWSYTEAQEIYARIGHSAGQAITLHSLGEVYRHHFKYNQAISSYNKAKELYARIGNAYDLDRANLLYDLGNLYRNKAKLDDAISSYNEAKEIYTRIGHNQGLANTLRSLGELDSNKPISKHNNFATSRNQPALDYNSPSTDAGEILHHFAFEHYYKTFINVSNTRA
ncbi:hypothetical protein M407DRAFT_30911 [Tulasnella calospora MUT 4182]|uniref:Protein kinase domain-containing protein n=1 Tax=Tulasnella calospora MUT 4182 TaxID=1051891 RepID=A0A0C3Q7F1_9AGAM|nr:hypothetical protein M407DRAFT_30911 [Tulasnella calospora MUT 4182]